MIPFRGDRACFFFAAVICIDADEVLNALPGS